MNRALPLVLVGMVVLTPARSSAEAPPAAAQPLPPPPMPPPLKPSSGATTASPPPSPPPPPAAPPPAGPAATAAPVPAAAAGGAVDPLAPASPEATPEKAGAAPDLKWHVPAEGKRFVAPVAPEGERPLHFIPTLRFRPTYLIDAEEIAVEASVRAGIEAIAGTLGVVTVDGDPVPLAGVEAFGFFGIDLFAKDGLSAQVLLPDIAVAAIFESDLILRAGSGLSGLRVTKCMGPISVVGQLRLPIIDVWMVPDDDFEDPAISIGTMLEIGIAL